MSKITIKDPCFEVIPTCSIVNDDSCKKQVSNYVKCVIKNLPESNDPIPSEISQCIIQVPNYRTHDSRTVTTSRFKDGKQVKQTTKIGRIINKVCPEYNNLYQEWIRKHSYSINTIKAIQKAMEYRITKNRSKKLEGLNGKYETSDSKYSFIISNFPVDIVTKSTGQSWEKSSCERIGGLYGDPKKWIDSDKNCGFCSDIEQGNSIIYLYDNERNEKIGRLMIRWGNPWNIKTNKYSTDKCVGLEPRWYGQSPSEKLRQDLKKILKKELENNDFVVDYQHCKTPYIYKGYSDLMGAGNVKINYSNKISKQYSSMEPGLRTLFESYEGREVYFYSTRNNELSCTEHITIDIDEFEEIKKLYNYYDTYTDDPNDLVPDVFEIVTNDSDFNYYEDIDDFLYDLESKSLHENDEQLQLILEKYKTEATKFFNDIKNSHPEIEKFGAEIYINKHDEISVEFDDPNDWFDLDDTISYWDCDNTRRNHEWHHEHYDPYR